MKFITKYKLVLLKSYLDKGLSLTNYLKYLIAFFALATSDLITTLFIGVAYGLISFAMGYLYFRYDWNEAEIEVQNRYNRFVKEMRKKLK